MQHTVLAPADDADSAAFLARVAALAAAGDLSVTALIAASETLRTRRRPDLVLDLYRAWLRHNGVHPLSYAARFNFASALTDAGELAEARDQLRLALLDKPDFAPACINLGSAMERLGDRVGAVETWRGLANRLGAITGEAATHRTTALNQMGRVLEGAILLGPAEAVLNTSLELDPNQREVIQHVIALRQAQCCWPVLSPVGRLDTARLLAASSPLALAGQIDDPILQLANAHRYHCNDAQVGGPITVGAWPPPDSVGAWPPPDSVGAWPPPEQAARRPLRIGYVSSDMREHAVGYLTAEVFELHDRARVEVFAYYNGIAHDDPQKARFRANADHWTDIRPLSERAAATAIAADNIDILIDLNGYTKDGRIKLFGYRPAPCIVNWLGYPGTTGSPHHHYIIADGCVIPPRDEIFYSEKVLRLNCYQSTDRKRVVAPQTQSRAELGLPDDGFVFCVFNGPQKIVPDVFAVWMEILREVPRAVLWMLCADAAVCERLRGHAQAAGIEPARLVFAGRMANPQHMARYRRADLFLDTAPYGAHTTASDALWMGVPVLTVAGNGFATRVCASLVRAAGTPETICADWNEYRARAIALARDPVALGAIAGHLRGQRDTCALFDTPALVRGLEDIYDEIWRDYCNGRQPVPRLNHLPEYHRLGCDPDRPALPDRASLLAWWRSRLAYRNAVQPLPADGLLWPGDGTPS